MENGYLNGFGKVERDVYKALEGADALVLMTVHREFREIDMGRVNEEMRTAVMIDERQVFDRDVMRRLGFEYRGVENSYSIC